MDAKQYCERVLDSRRRLEAAKRRVQELRVRSTALLQSPVLNGCYVQGGKSGSAVEKAAIDAQEAIANAEAVAMSALEDHARITTRFLNILCQIGVTDAGRTEMAGKMIAVMQYIYCDGLNVCQAADRMRIRVDYARQLNRKGIKALQAVLDGDIYDSDAEGID